MTKEELALLRGRLAMVDGCPALFARHIVVGLLAAIDERDKEIENLADQAIVARAALDA